MTNVTITKGEFNVIIHTVEVTEDYANAFRISPLPQTKQNQDSGPKGTKVIDLLKITHSLMIRGWVNKTSTKSAKEVIDDLKSIFEGGGTKGGNASIVYDGDILNMFPEKLTIIKGPLREPSNPDSSIAQYQISMTLVEGTAF